MSEILVRAGCFCAIIMMGFILKKASFFRKEDFALLSKIVIRTSDFERTPSMKIVRYKKCQ